MEKYRAVIDTNVVYAGIYSSTGASHQVLRLIENGQVTPLLSTTLLFEYEEILRRSKRELRLSDRDVDDVLNDICKHGEQRHVHFLWRPQLRDPKDDHVLELAVACGNADIVTYNLRDFDSASRFGIRILTPSQLLGEVT